MNAKLVEHAEKFANLDRQIKAQRAASDLEAYWYEVGPYGQPFDHDRTASLAVSMCRRYEACLAKIAQQSPEFRAMAMEALGLESMDQVDRLAEMRKEQR